MAEQVACELCGRMVPVHCSYIVRIDVLADPSMPAVTSEEIAEMNFDEELRRLLEEMKGMSAEQLQDQVHRHFEYRICRGCQVRFLGNPMGKPREKVDRSN